MPAATGKPSDSSFVSHICPASLGPRPHARKVGSFCTFHCSSEPRPTRRPPLPAYPNPPKFGFVLRIHHPAGPNWVRFAHFAPGGITSHMTAVAQMSQSPQVWLCFAHSPPSRAKLGSFSASCLRRAPAAGIFASAIPNPQNALASRCAAARLMSARGWPSGVIVP
jgi:hypothetical protein